ncbi:hypothetical protein KY290_001083 [Solanum tuberosum]|uniref:Uncharacterized protein n=1 Tax=Solanum tuberosum TaxID=4113 RepID=A0ABQ7WNE2_SOLTU|nr:hypothetical protein KY290_001083 [Solanum tuberosum]
MPPPSVLPKKRGPPEENSLPPTFPPQLTSLQYVIPPQWPSLPPNILPLSTSLPPSFFSIPPPGTNTSLDNKICANTSYTSSSCQISQNSSSSSLLPSSIAVVSPTSSTPSTRTNIGVSLPASSSIISTTAPACSKAQDVGGAREYDVFHRLIVTLHEDGNKYGIGLGH